ncbi:unnamed protein product [Parascedosporium putredinis]|uniref:Small ribosomal subunit protein mS41 n=1 Tax=Parascedosporium putredinis TaxID=1442378 RepID=A0A9P1M6W1_9PEZI|nr:unnamed protein product [Parascedosporium putredinis]CAI7987551.1 unnamed protein product [Parascedosporium putredinis]
MNARGPGVAAPLSGSRPSSTENAKSRSWSRHNHAAKADILDSGRFSASSPAGGPGKQTRCLHSSKLTVPRPVPPPIPIVPDPESFLRIIGRNLSQYSDKFPTWEALFTLTSPELKEIGVEPARSRRYLLQWLRRYREGKFGPGGDFQHVQDGKAILSVLHDLKTDKKKVVNVPAGGDAPGANKISGPYATPIGNGKSQVTVTEGMWEFRQGQKVDGGERRKAEVRFKRRVAERKAAREEQGH